MSSSSSFRAEDVLLEANLREFQSRVERACSLQRGGKLTLDECLDLIGDLARTLFHTRHTLAPES